MYPTDDELEEMSIEERRKYTYPVDWDKSVADPVWAEEDAEERRLYDEHQEELKRHRWDY